MHLFHHKLGLGNRGGALPECASAAITETRDLSSQVHPRGGPVGLSGAAEDAAEGRLEIWGGGEGAPRLGISLEAFKHILAH